MSKPELVASPKGWLVLPCRVVLGGLFVFAAVMKLQDPQQFAFSVAAFKLIPDSSEHLAVLSTFVVPWTELVAGVALLLGLWTRAAAATIAVLLIAFIGGIVSVLARGMDVSCGCFGKFEWPCVGKIGACQLVRNAVLLAVAGVVVLWGPGPLSLDRRASR